MKNNFLVIGVMSGTSLDGIDLAYCKFSRTENGQWNYQFLESATFAYPGDWKTRLKEAIHVSMDELQKIDQEYTEYLSRIILRFIEQKSIETIDAICSHGHTIVHQPENGITLQIGNRSVLAQLTDQKIVCDFRVQDVQLGGQGAPLVPIGDQLLFGEYDHCLNLGGFANISHQKTGERIAYDICPVNIVLNHYVQKLGMEFDDEGKLAADGKLDRSLLDSLNELSYYHQDSPKSLGLEWVISNIFPLIDKAELNIKDILRTFIEHIAIQISSELKKDSSVLITGGGAYNSFLINRLESMSEARLVIPNHQVIEYKEALIFGLLGVLRLRYENNCLARVTGAVRDHCSGQVYKP